ncbi:hypothetical protein ABH927_000672 [Planotetraspora sp. GP83]
MGGVPIALALGAIGVCFLRGSQPALEPATGR